MVSDPQQRRARCAPRRLGDCHLCADAALRVWRFEKQVYSKFAGLRPAIKPPYIDVPLARAIRHRDAIAYVRNYRRSRGMDILRSMSTIGSGAFPMSPRRRIDWRPLSKGSVSV